MSLQEFVNLWELMTSQPSQTIVQTDDEAQAVPVLLEGKEILFNSPVTTPILRALYEGGTGAVYTPKGDKIFTLVGEESAECAFAVRSHEDNGYHLFAFKEVLDELVEGEKVWFWDAMEARIQGYLDA